MNHGCYKMFALCDRSVTNKSGYGTHVYLRSKWKEGGHFTSYWNRSFFSVLSGGLRTNIGQRLSAGVKNGVCCGVVAQCSHALFGQARDQPLIERRNQFLPSHGGGRIKC